MSSENENCQKITKNHKKRVNPRNPLRIQQRALEQQRGLGEGEKYQSFLCIERNGFSSKGRSHIWLDPLNPSIVSHVLSDLERSVLMHASAVDGSSVRTQYPLWRVGIEPEFVDACESTDVGTARIAQELGFKPPRMQGEDTVLTVDLLVKFPSGRTFAVYVKYRKELPIGGTRAEELLLITREYWRRRNVELLIVTEVEAKDASTIRWLDWAASILGSFVPGSENFLCEIVQNLVEETDSTSIMNDRIACIDFPRALVVHALKYAIWVGFVLVDYQRWDSPCLADPWTIELASNPSTLVSANCFATYAAEVKP